MLSSSAAAAPPVGQPTANTKGEDEVLWDAIQVRLSVQDAAFMMDGCALL